MTAKQDPTNQGNAETSGAVSKFLPSGDLGPLSNREECEAQLKRLPPDQREFAEESVRFADLWQYFAEHRIQLPEDVATEVAELPKASREQQLTAIRLLNQRLMEYLHDVSEDSGIRQ